MRKHFVCLASIGLAGCSVSQPYTQPIAPIGAAYPYAEGEGSRTAATIGWQEFFGDPRLKVYIATALENNRDLAASVARIAAARAQYRIQNAQRLPQLDLGGGAARSRVPLATGGGAGAFTGNQFDVSASVSAFELDFWGRVRNLSEAARANYLGTVEASRAFRLSLIADVASTYLSMRAGEERIALARRSLTSRQEGLEIAKLRLDAGVTSTIDYDQSLSLVTQAETTLAEIERTTAQTNNQLLVLIGGPIADALPAPRAIDDQGQFASLDPGLPSELLISRPDIREAEQALRAADANIGAARAAFFPTISLTGAFGFASAALGDLFKGASQSWSFGGGLGLPVFDGGRRSADLARTKALREEAVAKYQKAVQVAFREVSDGLAGRKFYADQIAAQVRAVAAQRRLAETARLRYDNGITIYLEVLDAERNLFDAEQQLTALRSVALQNDVSLYVALGGGPDGSVGFAFPGSPSP
ncbi:MAG: efflux transporter outer membrane subunit [Sphingomonadales bacterium]|nr:MAG: efflux transporter outer membrane subunit [Sphingomonadales bacterium]